MSADYILDLDRISKPILTHHKATIVLITPAPPRAVRRFVQQSSLSIPVFSDAPRSLYTALNMNFRFDSKLEYRVSSRHVRTTVPEAWVKGFVKGVTEGLQGDPRQQGGSFVLGPALRTCTFAHFDRFNADHVPIPDLLTAVGIPDWREVGAFKYWDEMTEEEKAVVKDRRSK
ncbi:hypothetical protein M427DRAFT_383502 [Gonapodya prolifera JEL478]|uniref:Uncharacterized protein n=1 Tax=Gonapodya prolifera (strain JEL478) TaxID=1344416 RepID=A0A139A8Q2_GONPJ|nr:hypothetical protein M427DRAFT_383502 [Gonapodya prolifera JEL478]|eukprot:KXS13176.1 hypothetical protein M427DRAFT_383502 [Gonapodya prolifera JEL478]